ncbi:MAG: right-handed parallel beta-helix repeat-containing protein [Akkermansiaceae bacterium]
MDKRRGMTLTEARKILGLGPDEDPRPHLEEFRAVREQIAEMVRTAPNEHLAQRYQKGLVDFDRALAAVREYLEALGLVPRLEETLMDEVRSTAVEQAETSNIFTSKKLVKQRVGPPVLKAPSFDEDRMDFDDATGGIGIKTISLILLLLTLAGFGGWMYLKIEEDRFLQKQARVAFLERQGAIFIENRRWPEAGEAFDEIATIFPDSELVRIGRRSIEAGMVEEQSQFIGYWSGEALAAFEASRWDDSEKAARQVLDKYPNEKEMAALIEKIALAKVEEERQAAFQLVREQIQNREFTEAISGSKALIESGPEDQKAVDLLNEVLAAKKEVDAQIARAQILLQKALAKDTGVYDEEALEWLREAVALAPEDKTIQASYQKMAAYTQTLRVPGDFETIQAALDASRDRDRIVIGEGVWQGPFIVNTGVEIEGDSGKTILECSAETGSVISISPGVEGARVSGMTLRHKSFDAGKDRYSLALVRDAKVDFADCVFLQGSGHGLAILDGGQAKVVRSRFSENGWNGIAVFGSGSLLEAEGNVMKGNFQNGIESWDGAAVILTKNECSGNTRNGIHIENGAASATLKQNILSSNREYGIVISSAGSGMVFGNEIEKNFLGGVVVKAKATKVLVKENVIKTNRGSGLILEKGLDKNAFLTNRLSANKGKQLLADVDFGD